jgi:Asp-tRNA(Asn)/Glu-tRNA(Gln) amidotransferase C subunit
MSNIKDNPVPSLEELARKYVSDKHIDIQELYNFIEFVNEQNGVETNKVQPNLNMDEEWDLGIPRKDDPSR